MSFNKIRNLFLMFIFILMIPSTLIAGEPTERIRMTTDKLIAIITDSSLATPEMMMKRNRMIREAVDMVFDWEAFSRRALARHWRKRTKEERKEFVYLFAQLLERTYMDKTRHYSGEKMVFLDETIDGEYGIVKAKAITKNGTEIPIDYKVRKKKGDWFVYDIYVEGVSLVNNYRVQFNNIIKNSSYNELVKRLKEKIEEK